MLRLIGCFAVLVLLGSTAQAVDIETVPVGNPGNAPDMRYNLDQRPEGFGRVDYEYRIGKYEVTAGQYRDFLNAVDPNGTNTLGLYSRYMNEHHFGCQITWNSALSIYDFSGGTVEAPGSTAADWENRPVTHVSFWDVARFANWLHNGQGDGDTENGSYINIGDQVNFARQPGATYVIPTEDEWYKAAYHRNDGATDNYFDYPTSSNTVPGRDMTEATNPGNNANYKDGDFLIGSPYYRTEVGEFELSESPYGTFDQGGNLWEWTETVAGWGSHDVCRMLRGSDWAGASEYMDASAPRIGYDYPEHQDPYIGFRIARVPEPGTVTLLLCGVVGLLAYGRRRRM